MSHFSWYKRAWRTTNSLSAQDINISEHRKLNFRKTCGMLCIASFLIFLFSWNLNKKKKITNWNCNDKKTHPNPLSGETLLSEDTGSKWGRGKEVGQDLNLEWEPKFSCEDIPECTNPAPPTKASVNKDIVQSRHPYCKFLISERGRPARRPIPLSHMDTEHWSMWLHSSGCRAAGCTDVSLWGHLSRLSACSYVIPEHVFTVNLLSWVHA